MSFKICTLLQITILFFLFCHSSYQNNNTKYEISDEIEVIETFKSIDLHFTFTPIMRVTVVGITERGNLKVNGNGFNWNGNKKVRIDKANFNKIQKVKPFKVGQLIQARLLFESSSKYPRKIMGGEIMTIIKITPNRSLVVFNRNWELMKKSEAQEKIDDINFKHIKIIRDEFKKDQTIQALDNFKTFSESPRIIKKGEIMKITEIDEDGDLAVYNEKWGNDVEGWISKQDFDLIKKFPADVELKSNQEDPWGLHVDFSENWTKWHINKVTAGKQGERLGIMEGWYIDKVNDIVLNEKNKKQIKAKLKSGCPCIIVFRDHPA